MRPVSYKIKLEEEEHLYLEQLVRKQTSPQNEVKRAKIILLASGGGINNKQIAEKLGIDQSDITRWTKRWIKRSSDPIEERINDLPRSGMPCQISAEQWCQIMALACETPDNYGLPITHWSHKELANEVIKQGIVATISASHLGVFLKKSTYNHTVAVTG